MTEVIFKEESSNPIRVERSVWNQQDRIDVRRMFYTRAGDLRMTKKGISLTIDDGMAHDVLHAARTVNGAALSVQDGKVIVERRKFKGVPILDIRRFYRGKPSHHGISLTEDVEPAVLDCIAELLGVEVRPALAVPTPEPPTAKPQQPAKPAPDLKLVARLRKMADAQQRQIDDKTRPMTQNPTPKRNKEYAYRCHEGANLQRCQTAMRLIADAIETGTLPDVLVGVKTKKDIYSLVRTRGRSEGYYTYYDSREYADESAAGKALQAMLDGTRDPEAEKRAEIAQMENEARLLVGQIPGFFPTPRRVINDLLGYANVLRHHRCLEPEAGRGDIADPLKELADVVDVCEVHRSLCDILDAKGHNIVAFDFLEYNPGPIYDRIVMNPPFERGQDMEHVHHAYDLLADNGRVTSVMSTSVKFNRQKKYQVFREWLDDVGGWYEDLPDGAFKESGTGVSTIMVVIDK